VSTTGGGASFATTRWSVVAAAGRGTDERARRSALGALCEAYWFPVYAFARRKGHRPEDARDLVQGFFTRLLEKDVLAGADAERGRFRSFLLGCFVHYSANERNAANARKRGGGRVGFSLDDAVAEERLSLEPADDDDPERVYQRTWARTVLEQVVVRLRSEYEEGGKGEIYEALEPTLTGDGTASSYREIAAALGTSEGAVKVAAHRLRRRFGEVLRREIADTVEAPSDVEDELRGLLEALA
jgi:RNA polymerase sigma-70 factor (ECF subfamily)